MTENLTWNGRQVQEFQPADFPEHVTEIFGNLTSMGIQAYCLFGGAPRDADLAAFWHEERVINDYDIRVWLQPEQMQGDWESCFTSQLLKAFDDSVVSLEPSAGTGRLRHIVQWKDITLDISVRAAPHVESTTRDCAFDRVLDSDSSLSAIAIAPGTCCCDTMYLEDRETKTISYFPNANADRLAAYQSHMQDRFPGVPARMLQMNMQQALDSVLKEMGQMTYQKFQEKLKIHHKGEFAMSLGQVVEFIEKEIEENPAGEIARLYKEYLDDQK